MKRRPLATLAFAVTALLNFAPLALTSACAIGPASPKYDGANIVLISIDTLRADRLGVYGYARAETPHIDRLAREGIRFEQVISPMPLTLPAHTSLMTALPTPAHGVQDNGAFEIALGATTLAEQLQEAGYENGAFIGAFVLHSRWGLNRGFAEYNDNFEYAQPGGCQARSRDVPKRSSTRPWSGFGNHVKGHGSPGYTFTTLIRRIRPQNHI